MRTYRWMYCSISGQWKNHVFPGWLDSDAFISLCGKYCGALNGKRDHSTSCEECNALLPAAEAKAQEEEQTRLAELEVQRPTVTQGIIRLLSLMAMDDMNRLFQNLTKQTSK